MHGYALQIENRKTQNNSALSKLGLQVHNDIPPLITEAWESCYHTTAPTHLRFFVFLYVARTKTGLSPGSGEMSPLPPLMRKGENMQPQCAHVPSAAALLSNVRLGKTATHNRILERLYYAAEVSLSPQKTQSARSARRERFNSGQ